MEDLSLDNILTEDQINGLFGNEESQEEDKKPEKKEKENKETPEEEINTTETSIETLFGSEKSESVGSEEETQGKKDTTSTSGSSSNFYSSIANALVEDGILQNLEDKDLSEIKTAEDFADIISSQIKNQLDERQKRVNEALDLGVEPSEIQKYEKFISILDDIDDDKITDESEEGENLRKNLIYQDCLNKGFSKEKALKMVDRAIKAGTDLEDAREALQENKSFYKKQYQSVIDKAKKEEKEEQERIKKQSEELKKSILEEDTAFGEVKVDKATRQRVYDSIMKPTYTTDSGERLTAIQRYELEHRTEFLKNVGLLFVLTNEFKDIDRLVTDKVQKETKKSLRNLEHTLKSSGNGFNNGNLSYANNSGGTDPESLFKGWKLSV